MGDPWVDDPNVPDNGPQVNRTIWACAAIATLFLGLRVACKWRRRSNLWWDDWILIASLAYLLAGCCIVSVNIAHGFGKLDKDINPANLNSIGLLSTIMGTLYTMSSAWSKTSFAISLLRIATPRLKILVWFLMVSMNIFMHAGTIINWITCHPVQKLWDHYAKGSCWPKEVVLPFGIFFSGTSCFLFYQVPYSGFMDLVLAGVSWFIIIKLQMNKREKIGVAIAMSMGIFAGITAIVKSAAMTILGRPNFNYYGVDLISRNVIEIATTMVAACIPLLRTLVYDLTWPSRSRGSRNTAAGRYIRSGSGNGVRSPSTRGQCARPGSDVDGVFGNMSNRMGSIDGREPSNSGNSDEALNRPCVAKLEEGRNPSGNGVDIEAGTYELEKMSSDGRPSRAWV
ncbi:hypothetical protein F5Y04DRAFT_274306 [Hypomontagnella monticulosa]|nr:hypothetical protein F5Y04DRAFT_274306 [Hypomontagnella monticulosa]